MHIDTSELAPHEKAILGAVLRQQQELTRIARKLYDYTHPVDEFQSNDGVPVDGVIQIMPDYTGTVRIETITASLPVGITKAALQLGNRKIVLYSGVATAVQTIVNLSFMGVILGESDERILTLTGVATTGFYIGLAGHALEREGNR